VLPGPDRFWSRHSVVDDQHPEIFLYDGEVEEILAYESWIDDIASCNRESSRSTWVVASDVILFSRFGICGVTNFACGVPARMVDTTVMFSAFFADQLPPHSCSTLSLVSNRRVGTRMRILVAGYVLLAVVQPSIAQSLPETEQPWAPDH
jgi:hypothetical protein